MDRGSSRNRIANLDSIRDALDDGQPIALILVRAGRLSASAGAVLAQARAAEIPISIESEREMRRMSESDEAAELLAVSGAPVTQDLDLLMRRDGLVLILVALRYPGNVGFILRSAEVAGAAGVVVANGWAASEWEEAHRVGIRANRFFSVVAADAGAAVEAARDAGRRVIAVETSGRSMPWEVDLSKPTALLLGSETTGIPDEILGQADEIVRIPTRGFIPSYNVQAATGMLLGEWLRQTAGRPG